MTRLARMPETLEPLAGIAVHIGASVAANAQPRLLDRQRPITGSGLTFEDRGSPELTGIPGEWRLYAVAKTS
jgi:hypothetical protein